MNTADFRRALALGIDRDQINETFWLGRDTQLRGARRRQQVQPARVRKLWATLDVKKANEMLDRSASTRRTRGLSPAFDGKSRLRIGIMTLGASSPVHQIAEMIREQWKKIGIDLTCRSGASLPQAHRRQRAAARRLEQRRQ